MFEHNQHDPAKAVVTATHPSPSQIPKGLFKCRFGSLIDRLIDLRPVYHSGEHRGHEQPINSKPRVFKVPAQRFVFRQTISPTAVVETNGTMVQLLDKLALIRVASSLRKNWM